MRFQNAPEEGVIGIDLDHRLFLPGDLLLLVDRLKHARDGRAGKAQEQYPLTRLECFPSDLGSFENGDSGLARAGAARDKLMAFCL